MKKNSCCGQSQKETCGNKQGRLDWILLICGAICVFAVIFAWFNPMELMTFRKIEIFCHGIIELLSKMWVGVAFGMVAIGILGQIPRDVISSLLGKGISRAIFLGIFLDLCNHGILLIGAKLYQRGATLGQTFAFLIASPWNSFSLTFVLFGLIGMWWTLAFIAISALVGFVTGWTVDALTKRGVIDPNPNQEEESHAFSMRRDFVDRLRKVKWTLPLAGKILRTGFVDSLMLVRWLLLGVISAALIRSLVPGDIFATWLGPSLIGLALTMVATTLIEVCSEGSIPIASDLMARAAAPGNAFAFLMGGVATDYTEMMVLREATGKWKLALLLPLITVPQVVLLGMLLNFLGR